MNNIFEKYTKINKNKGSLLFELLIVIALFAIILSFGANAIYLSLRSNKLSIERDVALSVASETMEATRAVIEEDWQNIYGLTKGTTHYYPSLLNDKWVLLGGDGSITLNDILYTKYITINNVSRDYSTRDILNTYSSIDDDPSTQKVTVTVSWPNGSNVTILEYFFRWKNKTCGQSGWATGGSLNTVIDCADNNYDTKDASIDISTGSLKLQ